MLRNFYFRKKLTYAHTEGEIKVLAELFQKLAGQGQHPCRTPQSAELPYRSIKEKRHVIV